MGIQTNDKLAKLIREKYGDFSKDTMKQYFLEEFFVGSIGRKIDEPAFEAIYSQMELLSSAQGISMEDIDYLGFGQRFSTLGVGDAVIKVGNTTEKVFENPYRLSPVHQEDIGDNLGLYVSQRARTTGVKEKDVQFMYGMVRDAGGLWIDLKEENLGFVDNPLDFSSIYPGETHVNDSVGQEFPDYNGNLFVMDYEDMLFYTPEIIDRMKNGDARNINSVSRSLLDGSHSREDIYFEGFIKNSNNLLEHEIGYQRERGNLSGASKSYYALMKNERQIRQYRYQEEQRFMHDRHPQDIGDKFSIREIAMQIAQKTNIKALDKIIELVNAKKRERKERKIADAARFSGDTETRDETVSLVLEEIDVADIKDLEDPYRTDNANARNGADGMVDLEDPYRTR